MQCSEGGIILVAGSGRCGTHVVRGGLIRHSQISNRYNEWFEQTRRPYVFDAGIWPNKWTLGNMTRIEAELRELWDSVPEPVIVEKSCRHAPWLPIYADMFSDGFYYICVHRDPRDAWASVQAEHRRDKQLWPVGVREWCSIWAWPLVCLDDPRIINIQYESLVADPQGQFADLLQKLGLPQEDIAGDVHAQSVGRWRRDISPEDARLIQATLGRDMERLGYGHS